MEAYHNSENANEIVPINSFFPGRGISFEDMNASDELLIRTENSKYRFSVIDPARKYGTLSGGTLGDELCDAILVGGIVTSDKSSTLTQGLMTESRAMFSICTARGLKQLLTSAITELTHMRAAAKEP